MADFSIARNLITKDTMLGMSDDMAVSHLSGHGSISESRFEKPLDDFPSLWKTYPIPFI